MTIIHIQSQSTGGVHGQSAVSTRRAGEPDAPTGFEALFALEIEVQNGGAALQPETQPQTTAKLHASTQLQTTQLQTLAQTEPADYGKTAQPGTDEQIATSDAATEVALVPALLPPGLLLPATPPAPPSGNVQTRDDTARSDNRSNAAQPSRRIAAAGNALPQAASDDLIKHSPAPRSEIADGVLAALQPAGKSFAESVSAPADASTLSTAAEKSAPQALLNTQSPQSALRVSGEAAAPLVVRAPIDAPQWGQEFAQRVILVAGRHEKSAEIRINPQHLGPIEVSVTLSGDDSRQATVHFSAAHAPVREVIEAALPRLRELFEQAGIQLGNATVGAETSGRDNSGDTRRGAGNASAAAAATTTVPVSATRVSEGMVDTFA